MDAGGYEAERRAPVGGVGTAAALLLLAVGSGAAVFVGLALLSWAAGWPVRLALAGSGLGVLGVWAWVLAHLREMWCETETIRPVVSLDPAPTTAAPPVVSVELVEADRGRLSFLDLPGAPEAIAELAAGTLQGRPLSEGEWTGAHRPFSRADFRELRGVLLERGLPQWRRADAPAQGVELTLAGRAVFRRLAEARTHAHARTGGHFLPESATQ